MEHQQFVFSDKIPATKEELLTQIKTMKKELGNKLLIVAHHYVQKEIVKLADIVGDSYKLALDVSKQDATHIIFCGVMFMGEGAATLAKENQHIYLPNVLAGCPMADMITSKKASDFCDYYKEKCGKDIAPLVYMNSNLETKAFVGRQNGSVCTSSNAKKIVTHYLNQNIPIFFFPDKNLGFNTAKELGLQSQDVLMVLDSENGYQFINMDGKIATDFKQAKMIMWHGYCPIHHAFLLEHIETQTDNLDKKSYLLVHPEVELEVASKADFIGSTQAIENHIKKLQSDPAFSPDKRKIIIGTEATFVKRLNDSYHLDIVPLEDIACVNMKKITLEDLYKTLLSIKNFVCFGAPLPPTVIVDPLLKNEAAIALKNMIEISES